jgi:hypothetical protein
MGAALGVAEEGDDNMSIAEVEDSFGSVRRKPTEQEEEGRLYSLASMPELLLCRGQGGLNNSYKVLDVHRHLLPFLII